jgi:hypothetical protein
VKHDSDESLTFRVAKRNTRGLTKKGEYKRNKKENILPSSPRLVMTRKGKK